jgi:hypothetical protein
MPSDAINLCWVDGELLPGNRAVVRADDSVFARQQFAVDPTEIDRVGRHPK